MTAKEYLRQVGRINAKIKRLTKQRDDIRADMYSIGSPAGMDTERVRTSMAGDKMLRLIGAVDDLEREIVEELCQLTRLKGKIYRQVESLDDERYKTILFDRYILLMSWEQIAVDMGYQIKWVYKLHGNALQSFSAKVLSDQNGS